MVAQRHKRPPVRVLFLNSSVSGGGAGRALINMIRGFDPAEIESHVILPFDGVVGEGLREAGAQTHYYPLMPERFGKTSLRIPSFLRRPSIERLANFSLLPRGVRDLITYVQKTQADLVYANHLILSPGAVLLGHQMKIPVILHSREVLPDGVVSQLFCWLARRRPVQKVVCVSKVAAKAYKPSGKTEVLYDTIDCRTHPANVRPMLRAEYGLGKDQLVIGFMGRLVERKGVLFF